MEKVIIFCLFASTLGGCHSQVDCDLNRSEAQLRRNQTTIEESTRVTNQILGVQCTVQESKREDSTCHNK